MILSAITLAELRYGAVKSQRWEQNQDRSERILARFEEKAFDEGAARAYGAIRAKLETNETPIGPLDTLLAGHALSLGATMVTNNTREFSRVSELKLESWREAT